MSEHVNNETLKLFARLVNPGRTPGTLRGFVTETAGEVSSCRRVRSNVASEALAIQAFLDEGAAVARSMTWVTWDSLSSVGIAVSGAGRWKVAARRYGVSFRVTLPVDGAEFLARFLRAWLCWGEAIPLPEGVELRMVAS